MYQSLYALAVVFLAVTAGWVWFRRKADSILSDMENQISLFKLRLQDVEDQLSSLQTDLKQRRIIDCQPSSGPSLLSSIEDGEGGIPVLPQGPFCRDCWPEWNSRRICVMLSRLSGFGAQRRPGAATCKPGISFV